MKKQVETNEVKVTKLSITELFERLGLTEADSREPSNFDLNNEVYNPYSNTHKVTFSTDSEVK